ncbi:MAG: tetratricopeptide repeat protein [Theionarchaea archaeon]|nr:tetratricopeptide repeat protein [Theionarchaea archaeon]
MYSPHVARVLNNLGALYCSTGRFSKAEKVYQEALEILKNSTKRDPFITGRNVKSSIENFNLYDCYLVN